MVRVFSRCISRSTTANCTISVGKYVISDEVYTLWGICRQSTSVKLIKSSSQNSCLYLNIKYNVHIRDAKLLYI